MVTIQLDKERNLFFGVRALREIQKKTGKNPYARDFWDQIDAESVSAVIWAGLLHEDKNLTVDQVEQLIDNNTTIGSALSKCTEAYIEALQDQDNPLPQTESKEKTGSKSGASQDTT